MKALIIDDERLARQELKNMLQQYPEIIVAGECANAEEVKEQIEKLQPDLVFLDIQMPGKNGFELLEEIEILPKVVFVTAYDEYALRAFEVNALDYLLKPIEQKRLDDTIHKLSGAKEVDEVIARNTSNELLTAEDQVFVKDGEKCWFVKLSEVRLFESAGNYVKVYFKEFKPMVLKSLNSLDERLDQKTFFRASRKHIINLKWVENIENWFNGGLMLTLKGGEKIEVSRRQAVKFKEMMSL